MPLIPEHLAQSLARYDCVDFRYEHTLQSFEQDDTGVTASIDNASIEAVQPHDAEASGDVGMMLRVGVSLRSEVSCYYQALLWYRCVIHMTTARPSTLSPLASPLFTTIATQSLHSLSAHCRSTACPSTP